MTDQQFIAIYMLISALIFLIGVITTTIINKVAGRDPFPITVIWFISVTWPMIVVALPFMIMEDLRKSKMAKAHRSEQERELEEFRRFYSKN